MLDLHIQLLSCSHNCQSHIKSCIHKHCFHTYSFYPAVTAQHSTHTQISRAVILNAIFTFTHTASLLQTQKTHFKGCFSTAIFERRKGELLRLQNAITILSGEVSNSLRTVKYQTVWLAKNKDYRGVIFPRYQGVIFPWPPTTDDGFSDCH